ncbi:MAG: 50S ribosomal protein L3 [bacterium]
MKGLIGKKLGMTQLFSEKGERLPVTVLSLGPCVVVRTRTKEKDGYEAVQIGWLEIKPAKLRQSERKLLEKAGLRSVKYLREIRVDKSGIYSVGQELDVEIFKVGEKVDVVGTSKGKGFAGGMKRWNFHGGPASHGSMTHRQPASAGSTCAAKVIKGKKMPGRLGGVRRTVQGLEIVKVDRDKNLLVVRGNVPGSANSLVIVSESVKENSNFPDRAVR